MNCHMKKYKQIPFTILLFVGNLLIACGDNDEVGGNTQTDDFVTPPEALIQQMKSYPELSCFTEAFKGFKMKQSEWDKGITLFVPLNKDICGDISIEDIKKHIVSGVITKDIIIDKITVGTLSGNTIPIEKWPGETFGIRLNGVELLDYQKSDKYVLYVVERDLFAVPGSIVVHSPTTTQRYIGNPSICILPNGDYLASHDFFGPGITSGVSRIYRSKDKGVTWALITELSGTQVACFFSLTNTLYFMGLNKTGQVIIRKSTDNGLSWTTPANSQTGLLRTDLYQTAASSVIIHNGRIWKAVEKVTGPISGWARSYEALMMSALIGDDLLDAANWIESTTVPYNSSYLGGKFEGMLEGGAVLGPDNHVYNMLRVHTNIAGTEYAAKIKTSSDGTTVSFNESSDLVIFPGGSKKFTVIYDSLSNRYWTLSNVIAPSLRDKTSTPKFRNTLALCSSPDMVNWTVNKIMLNHPDVELSGFQYVDWTFDGQDIIYLSRTSFDDGNETPPNFHDANYLLFFRIANFRQYKDVVYPY